jgi:hypothetical protein
MTPEMLHLAKQLAAATGADERDARRALESGDPSMIRLAHSVVNLGDTREAWHEDMDRHRRRILRAAV